MKFTASEAIMFLLIGFALGMFLMALIQWLEHEWGDIDDFMERIKTKCQRSKE